MGVRLGDLLRLSLVPSPRRSSFGVSLAGKVDSQGHNKDTSTTQSGDANAHPVRLSPEKKSFIASESDDYAGVRRGTICQNLENFGYNY